jgi:hypothetical protein
MHTGAVLVCSSCYTLCGSFLRPVGTCSGGLAVLSWSPFSHKSRAHGKTARSPLQLLRWGRVRWDTSIVRGRSEVWCESRGSESSCTASFIIAAPWKQVPRGCAAVARQQLRDSVVLCTVRTHACVVAGRPLKLSWLCVASQAWGWYVEGPCIVYAAQAVICLYRSRCASVSAALLRLGAGPPLKGAVPQ